MSKKPHGLDVSILGREFRVSCSEREEPALKNAVQYVDSKMREIRDQGKVIGVDRIAIMAALNIAHELLNSGSDSGLDGARLEGRILHMQKLIEQALAGQDELF
jgi:cell division protein ZapA